MKYTRRNLGKALIATTFLLSGQQEAAFAALFSGGTAVAPPTQLTSMTLANTSGSSTTGCSPMFGHPFKKGAIPTGTAPIFKTTGGTVIPFSMSKQPALWSDGSIKHAAFILNLAAASQTIAGSGTLTVNIFSGGTVPSASGRALSDFAIGGTALNVTAVGQDNLSGTWVSDLNQGVSAANADNYVYMDGDAGKVWRVRASFRQSSANHGQLEGYWFAASLNDASAAFGGIRFLTRIAQPWYNVSSPAPQYRSFSALGVFNGASQIHDLVADMPTAKTFTWSGSGANLTSTANGYQSGMACYLSTTGTLPAGLSTGQMYCTLSTGTNSLQVGLSFSDTIQNAVTITPTNAGSGVHTMTLLPMVTAYGTIWTCETNGRWSYQQGGGSVTADSTVLVKPNMTYWCETTLLPPYALGTYSPASNSSYSYFCDTGGPYIRNIGQTGESEQIGPLPSYFARHIFTLAAVDEQLVRLSGLIAGHLPVCLRDNATHAIPVVNNTTYANMPAKNQNFRWYANPSNVSGFTPPSNTNVYTQGWSYVDYSHMPQWTYYPYFLTGEPQFMDVIVEYANCAVMHEYTGTDTAVVSGTVNSLKVARNGSINGNTYAGGIFHADDLLRAAAWPISMLGDGAGIINTPENASYHQYLLDMLTTTFAGYADYRSMLQSGATYAYTNGMWNEADNADGGIQDSWTLGYLIGACCKAYAQNELTTISDHIQYMVKWPAHVFTTWSAWLIPYYQAMSRVNGASCQAGGCNTQYITTDTQFAVFGFGVSWNSGTNFFTLTATPSGYTLNNGDVFMWNGTLEGTVPAGLSGNNVPYFVVNKSGSTFQLSTTLGGSPVTLTDTGSAGSIYGLPSSLPSTGFLGIPSATGSGYPANNLAHLSWVAALGLTVNSSMVSDMSTRALALSGWTSAVNADPKYAMGSSYP